MSHLNRPRVGRPRRRPFPHRHALRAPAFGTLSGCHRAKDNFFESSQKGTCPARLVTLRPKRIAMSLSEIYPLEREAPEEQLSASVRQLEALTALAAAPGDGRALEELFAGLADTITELTDYRSCLVVLFNEDGMSRRVLSYSSNVPREFIEDSARRAYKREDMARLVERGVRI